MTFSPVELTYQLTPELSRAATWRYFQHQLGWRVPLTFLLYAALCAILPLLGSDLLAGIFIGAGVLLVMLVIAAYVIRTRRKAGLLALVTDRAARCRITEEGIELHNELGSGTFPWRMIRKAVRYPDVWLLYVGPQPIWLPAGQLQGEAGRHILERAPKII